MGFISSRLPDSMPGSRLLALFALPFAAIGTFMAFFTLRTLLAIWVMQGWPTVPATLQTVELRTSGASQRAAASYTYVFDGQVHTGRRVSLYGADNLGSFQRDTYRDLDDHRSRQTPYPVHVDPKAPAESILLPVLRLEVVGFSLVFVVLFGGVGWGIIVSVFVRLRRARIEAALVERYPNEPWKQRIEWSGARIPSTLTSDAIGETCLAVFWNAATFPVLLIIPREVAGGRYVALTFLVIPLVGAGAACWALVSLARAKRFGRTALQLDTMPARPGEPLRAHIYAPQALQEAESVALGLRCERQLEVPSRRGTVVTTEIAWSTEASTPVLRGQTSTGDVLLAVTVAVPTGFPSSSRGPGDRYLWLLSASAPLRGADFSVEFEVPVFDRSRG